MVTRPKMQNKQEEFLRLLAEHSMGAPFVFVPEKWRRPGGKWREPADLVWLGHECVILMYIKQKQRRGREDRAAFESLALGNIDQARGWLRAWRAGWADLCGENGYSTYRIPYGRHKHTIVLSLVDCDAVHVEAHGASAKDLNVTACITIPLSVLAAVTRMGGSLLDLLLIIQDLRDMGSAVSEEEAVRRVNTYGEAAWEEPGGANLPDMLQHPNLAEAWNHIQGLRVTKEQSNPMPKNPSVAEYWWPEGSAATFNDIVLRDLATIVKSSAIVIRWARESVRPADLSLPPEALGLNPEDFRDGLGKLAAPDQWMVRANLSYYEFLIGASKADRLSYEFGKKLAGIAVDHQRSGASRPLMTLMFDVDSHVAHLATIRMDFPRALETLLSNW
jgi:hypothetical protein